MSIPSGYYPDKTNATKCESMENEKWHWQEPGTWKGIGIYHVTLVVSSREALLGSLVIPGNDPAKARVDLSPFGVQIKACVDDIPIRHPEIRIIQLRMMPDHLHIILYVTKPMTISIKMVVRGLWQGAKKVGREKFTEVPFIRPMSHRGQLQTMIHYLQMNPQRLATKKLKPGYFFVQRGVDICSRNYDIVGNAAILTAERYKPVHVRRIMVEAAGHGDDTALKEYMNACVLAARKGAVMVSPFISPDERRILAKLLEEGLPFICIADNGFGDYYKPADGLFEALTAGKVLILSPWEYDPKKGHVTRQECIAMNKMAEEICEGLSKTTSITSR